MIDMLKAKFIDKILEVMGDEADKIYITRRDVDIYFKKNIDDEGMVEISKFVYSLELGNQVENYRISIDYELKTIEIHRGTNFVCLRNFNSCNGKIWTAILEEIEEDRKEMEEEQ